MTACSDYSFGGSRQTCSAVATAAPSEFLELLPALIVAVALFPSACTLVLKCRFFIGASSVPVFVQFYCSVSDVLHTEQDCGRASDPEASCRVLLAAYMGLHVRASIIGLGFGVSCSIIMTGL